MGWLIDTCIWVDIERKKIVPNDVARLTGKEPVFMSPVTIAELSAGIENTPDADIRAKRQAALARLMKKPCVRIDEDTGFIFGSIAGRLRREGRASEHRIQDLWIASSAVQHGHKLLTKNGKDFKDIAGLDLIVLT